MRETLNKNISSVTFSGTVVTIKLKDGAKYIDVHKVMMQNKKTLGDFTAADAKNLKYTCASEDAARTLALNVSGLNEIINDTVKNFRRGYLGFEKRNVFECHDGMSGLLLHTKLLENNYQFFSVKPTHVLDKNDSLTGNDYKDFKYKFETKDEAETFYHEFNAIRYAAEQEYQVADITRQTGNNLQTVNGQVTRGLVSGTTPGSAPVSGAPVSGAPVSGAPAPQSSAQDNDKETSSKLFKSVSKKTVLITAAAIITVVLLVIILKRKK